MSGHGSLFVGATKAAAVTINATTAGNIDLGAGNSFNLFAIYCLTDATYTYDRAASTGTALTSLSSTAAEGACAAPAAYSRVIHQGGSGRYLNFYNLGGASITLYVTAGTAPA